MSFDNSIIEFNKKVLIKWEYLIDLKVKSLKSKVQKIFKIKKAI